MSTDPKLAAEMESQALEQFVAENSHHGNPDGSLQDWVSGSDLSTESPADVVAEWDGDR